MKHPTESSHRNPGPAIVLFAVLALGIFGCSGEPPTAPSGGSGKEADLGPLGGPAATTAVQPVSAPVTGTVVTSSRKVSALLGGVVSAGRHTLVIPPGALTRDTIITLRDVTGVMGRVECEALPSGLQFRLPVLMVTRFADLKPPAGHALYWVLNEGTASEKWVLVGGQVTAGNLGISAQLTHFSRYCPGKNGW
jgi:hypothetical protein